MARYSDGSTPRRHGAGSLLSNNSSDGIRSSSDGKVTAGKPATRSSSPRFNRFTIGSEVIVLPDGNGLPLDESAGEQLRR